MSEQTALFQTPAPPTLEALINSLDSHHYLMGDAWHSLDVPGQKRAVLVSDGWLIVEPSVHEGYFFASFISDAVDGLKKPLLKSALAKHVEQMLRLPAGMTFEIRETDEPPATYNRWLFDDAEESFQIATLGKTRADLVVLREAKERADRKAERAAKRAAKAKGA